MNPEHRPSKPKDGGLDKSKSFTLLQLQFSYPAFFFFFLNLMFCLYFSVSTCSENRTGFGIRSSKHSSTSHCLSSKADVGLRGPKGLGASLKNTKLRAELNISLE